MLSITCPNDNIPERRYVINVLFNHLLNCDLPSDCIHFDDSADSYIIKKDNKIIEIEDHFFHHYATFPLEYLNISNIPSGISTFHALGKEVPLVFGNDTYYQDNERVKIGLDIFASTFFLLSHWDEYCTGGEGGFTYDNRCFTKKQNIYLRAVVHEYEYLLSELLGITSQRQFKCLITHDVDSLVDLSWIGVCKMLFCSLLSFRRAAFKKTIKDIGLKLHYPRPYTQASRYVSLSQKYGIDEMFFIKTCARGEVGVTYPYDGEAIQEVINWLNSQHSSNSIKIGFHPSESTFNNQKQWDVEVSRIKGLLKCVPLYGRNHHLLCNHFTFCQWESLGTSDGQRATMSNKVFGGSIGFRSSIAVPFPIFDIRQRREMRLYELPCEIMDTAVMYRIRNSSEQETMEEIVKVVDEVKKYRGQLVLNWHMLRRPAGQFKYLVKICDKILQYAL